MHSITTAEGVGGVGGSRRVCLSCDKQRFFSLSGATRALRPRATLTERAKTPAAVLWATLLLCPSTRLGGRGEPSALSRPRNLSGPGKKSEGCRTTTQEKCLDAPSSLLQRSQEREQSSFFFPCAPQMFLHGCLCSRVPRHWTQAGALVRIPLGLRHFDCPSRWYKQRHRSQNQRETKGSTSKGRTSLNQNACNFVKEGFSLFSIIPSSFFSPNSISM